CDSVWYALDRGRRARPAGLVRRAQRLERDGLDAGDRRRGIARLDRPADFAEDQERTDQELALVLPVGIVDAAEAELEVEREDALGLDETAIPFRQVGEFDRLGEDLLHPPRRKARGHGRRR